MDENAVAVVLAAGKGTRMKSELPKVLIEVCARPMIEYVLDALSSGGVSRLVVVVGYRADAVRAQLADRTEVTFVDQPEQLGTGHAAMVCREALAGYDGPVIVVAGDSPMLRSESIASLLDEFRQRKPACLLGTAHKEDPTGLGRVVRDENREFVAIVEENDATPEQKLITEVNLSCYVFDCVELFAALDQIRPDNAQGEYYITDCPGVLKQAGKEVRALDVLTPAEALSINTQQELSVVEERMQSTRGG